MNPYEKPARQCYERYSEHCDNKNYRGDPMPTWDELPQAIRDHWMYAIAELVDKQWKTKS